MRETAAEHLEERQADWAYSKPVVVLDVLWNLAFVAVAATVLAASLTERPTFPLRFWLAGYVLQCLLHVLCVVVEYSRRCRVGGAGVQQDDAGDGDFKTRTCPIDLKEAIASVIFASMRCSDVTELADVRKNFTSKYGKEFAASALEVRPDSGVNRLVIEKLSAGAPDVQTKTKTLSSIAAEHNIKWEPKAFEEQKQNEDRMYGSTYSGGNVPTPGSSGLISQGRMLSRACVVTMVWTLYVFFY